MVALLVLVLSQLENATALSPGARIEGNGDDARLVLDATIGPVPATLDPDGRLSGWLADVKHLAATHLLTFERNGREVRLGRGGRALKTLRGDTPSGNTAATHG